MKKALVEVAIKPEDMSAVLKERFEDITVFKADLPTLMNSISMNDKKDSILAVMVPLDSTYDEAISQLRLQAEKLNS